MTTGRRWWARAVGLIRYPRRISPIDRNRISRCTHAWALAWAELRFGCEEQRTKCSTEAAAHCCAAARMDVHGGSSTVGEAGAADADEAEAAPFGRRGTSSISPGLRMFLAMAFTRQVVPKLAHVRLQCASFGHAAY